MFSVQCCDAECGMTADCSFYNPLVSGGRSRSDYRDAGTAASSLDPVLDTHGDVTPWRRHASHEAATEMRHVCS